MPQTTGEAKQTRGSGQLLGRSVDVYLWRRASQLCREYNSFIVVLWILMLFLLFLVAAISLSLFLFMFFIDVLTQYLMLLTPLFPSFLYAHRLAIVIIYSFRVFPHQQTLMDFHWSLSDSKSPQVSRTLLSILAVLNNALVWMVSSRPPISKSSSPSNHIYQPLRLGRIWHKVNF